MNDESESLAIEQPAELRQLRGDLRGNEGRVAGKGIGGHTEPVRGTTDDDCTPRDVLDAIGPFDLDPCTGFA